MALIGRLRPFRGAAIGLDTMVFLYAFERHAAHGAEVAALLAAVEQGVFSGVTSTISATECLVHPHRPGRHTLVARYRFVFSSFPHLTSFAPDLRVADRAARLRAEHELRTPDSLLVATALVAGCAAFVTSDEALLRLPLGDLEMVRIGTTE